jgi:hypothetical protein
MEDAGKPRMHSKLQAWLPVTRWELAVIWPFWSIKALSLHRCHVLTGGTVWGAVCANSNSEEMSLSGDATAVADALKLS